QELMRHEGIGSEAGGFHSSARPPSVWTGCFRPWADPAPGPAPGASHPALTGMVPVPAVLADDFIRIRPCLNPDFPNCGFVLAFCSACPIICSAPTQLPSTP